MAGHLSVRPVMASLTRSRPSAPYTCRPCLISQQLQYQSRYQQSQKRSLHQNIKAASVPKPTPFVPDVTTFLTLIGRGMSTHASKITSWESLFSLSSPQLKELGIEPARSRRYLLRWREKFRKGEYGIGGDFNYVENGVGELRVLEIPSLRTDVSNVGGNNTTSRVTSDGYASTTRTPGMQKLVLNTPKDTNHYSSLVSTGQTSADLRKPAYVSLKDGHVILGSYVRPVKGSNGSVATLQVTEGLWEHKRGRKIFGGERRRAETLHKMRVEERKKN